jgi:hypothetical protein
MNSINKGVTIKRIALWIGAIGMVGTLFAQLSAVAQQIHSYAPWRLIGTNVYDFSWVIRGALNGDARCQRYFIRGRVSSVRAVEENSLTLVERAVGKPRSAIFYRGMPNPEYASSGELLQSLSAAQLAKNAGGEITLGQYMAMAPSMRANYEVVQLAPPVENILIRDLPVELRTDQAMVEFFALPIGNYKIQGASSEKGGVPHYLYGKQFRGSLTNHPVVFQVTPSGIQVLKIAAGKPPKDTVTTTNSPAAP